MGYVLYLLSDYKLVKIMFTFKKFSMRCQSCSNVSLLKQLDRGLCLERVEL